MRTRTALLAAAAMCGFAANSLLCRAALGDGLIDGASFTAIRLLSGAATLAVLVRGAPLRRGSFAAAALLFAYAAAFSFAYLALPAGIGALLLFGAVQVTMIAAGLLRGERPGPRVWTGAALALGGLLVLTLPGASAPAPAAAALMVLAGAAWGGYSLRGRGERDALGATAGNFARAVPLALLLIAAAYAQAASFATGRGVALAVFSGAVTSGLIYAVWYAALPGLTTTSAALVQLTVPVIAALGGVALLGEVVTARLWLAGALILGGVALAVSWRR